MKYYNDIAEHFHRSIENIAMIVDSVADPIEETATLISESLISGYKVMVCGFGVDSALANLFVSQSNSSLENERPGLPMLMLPVSESETNGALTEQSDFFLPALKSLGRAGDVLFCIDSNLREPNFVGLIDLAISREIKVIVLSHETQEKYRLLQASRNICILANASNRTHFIELSLVILQCLSSIVDKTLFGDTK